MLQPTFALVLQFTVGMVFAVSVTEKLRNRGAFLHGIAEYRIVPPRLVSSTAALLVVTEGAIAFAHLSGWMLQVVLAISLAVLSTFMVVVLATLKRGLTIACLCFGGDETVSAATVARIALLIGAEALLAFSPASAVSDGLALRELILALTCAAAISLAANWLLSVRELLDLARGCRGCGSGVHK